MARISESFNVNNFIVSQTNPFVIPFLDHSLHYRNHNVVLKKLMQLSQWVKEFALSEVRHRTLQMNKLGLVPNVIKRYVNMME